MVRVWALAFLFCLLSPVSAQAQTMPCAARERVAQLLREELGQQRLATGSVAQGVQMELFVAEDGRWTMIITLDNGQSCLLARGYGLSAATALFPVAGIPV
jgi:hypothetical protein